MLLNLFTPPILRDLVTERVFIGLVMISLDRLTSASLPGILSLTSLSTSVTE